MAKKKPTPASDQADWEGGSIEFGPEGLLRQLAKIPPADLKQFLAKAGVLEQPQDESKRREPRSRGRPQDSSPFNWSQIDPILDFCFVHPDATVSDKRLEEVRAWYRARFSAEAPERKTLRARIRQLRQHPLGSN
jgi:hypothetical protein